LSSGAERASRPTRPLPPLPDEWRSLGHAFVSSARASWSRPGLADSSDVELTFGETLIRSLALGRVLARTLGPEQHVGLLLPPMVPTTVTNLALALWGRVAINLNYTASAQLLDSAVEQAGITQVLTSKLVLERLGLRPKAELILLEDLRPKVTTADKLWAAAMARLAPVRLLERVLPGLRPGRLDTTAVVMFTSGSTGEPKGVMLTHRNILSNAHQVGRQLEFAPDDVVLGILPFFHCFGYTVTLWMTACLGVKTALHSSPLDAQTIGELCRKHRVTILLAAPTFMRSYLERNEPEQFASVRKLVLGSEKLKPTLAQAIRDRLGIEPLEGYGCSELSPAVAVNVPELELADGRRVPASRPGSVGIPLAGTLIATSDPDSGAPLPAGEPGLIWVKGPQVMAGYLGRPDLTAEVIRDGWYCTGDLGHQDEDGFLHIGDRLSRFSKIGGEMVAHAAVEGALMAATGADELGLAVTAVPDERRGERLVVIHTALDPRSAVRALGESGIPKLWIPGAEDFVQVDALPLLGTGKLDLKALRALALARG
jgi:acyl-[acyl-carrier-protein]-phospholipid O-acyltransferase / long-chain-fatty-acid--[acyl-carrier-protein] ligase